MRTISLFIILFFAALQLRAQESQPRLYLGVVGGYSSNTEAGWFETNGPHDEILDYVSGSSNLNGMILGFSGEYRLTDNGSIALQAKIYYEQKPSEINIMGPLTYFDTASSQVEPYPASAYKATYNLINFEPLIKFMVISRFAIAVGPTLGYIITKKYSESGIVYYYAPSSGVTPPYLPDTLNSSGNIPAVYSFRLGLATSLQYEFVAGKFLIIPALSYDAAITPIAQTWRVNTLAGTVDVMYGF